MVINSDEVRVLIPARSGSTGVKDKNVRIIGGHPLISYSIAVALKFLPSERVWVSTDSEVYKEIAQSYGASVPFLRPAKISQVDSTDFEVFQHALEVEKNISRTSAKYWIHLRPTSPIRYPQVILDAFKEFQKNKNATSLRSVHPATFNPFKWMLVDEKGFARTLSGDTNADLLNFPRQCYPNCYVPNGYVDIIKSESIRRGFLHGNRTFTFITTSVPDLDTEEDFKKLPLDELKKLKEFFWPI